MNKVCVRSANVKKKVGRQHSFANKSEITATTKQINKKVEVTDRKIIPVAHQFICAG